MPVFHYSAIDDKGVACSGVVEAAEDKDARSYLRMQGLILTKLKKKSQLFRANSLNQSEFLNFTLQLSQLLNANLPLYESLVALEEFFRDKAWHSLIVHLAQCIQRGSDLSEALALYPAIFDKRYVAMVKSAEMSGTLHLVFAQIADLLEKQMKLKKSIVTALCYPMILAGFCVLVIALLLFFVIPSIEALFEERALNPLTAFVLGISKYVRANALVLFGGVVFLVSVILARWKAIKKWPGFFTCALKMPILKDLIVQMAIARFFRTLSSLTVGGVDLIEAIESSCSVIQNPLLEKTMQLATVKISEGSKMSVELKKCPLIPPLVYRMLAVGEESGNIGKSFFKIAEIYEDEVSKTLTRMMSLMQPLLLLIMGAIVGLVMLSVLIPLTDMNSLIGAI